MKQPQRRADDDDMDPVKPPLPCTVLAQPRPRVLDTTGRRLERRIGYQREYVIRREREE